jgi:uncharacterized protein with FMN-binding domain
VRTRATLSGIFASVAILVVGWQAGTAVVASSTSPAATGTTTGSATGSSGGTASAAPSASASAPATASGSASAKSGTFTGSSIDTQFGSVQVQIVASGGKITQVKALHLTDNGGRSVQISNYAVPILRSEVLQSQSSQVSTVGGATYTSDAYLTSVQSAIDQAGL